MPRDRWLRRVGAAITEPHVLVPPGLYGQSQTFIIEVPGYYSGTILHKVRHLGTFRDPVADNYGQLTWTLLGVLVLS
jgi:hypothetical protein